MATMRRPYTARGFTYAEKIELMRQQNDFDTEYITKHIRSKSKRGVAELKRLFFKFFG